VKFGPTPLDEAEGAVLAHSLVIGKRRLRKGRMLGAEDLEALREAGMTEVIAARIEPDDIDEDAAAAAVAGALAGDAAAKGMSVSAPFTGRANIYAEKIGVLRVSAALVDGVNRLHEAVTLATLPDYARVSARQMLATVKIIPYAAPRAAVQAAVALLSSGEAMRVHAPAVRTASLILTATPGMKPTLLDKGSEALGTRLAAFGVVVADEARVAHETGALTEAVAKAKGEITLVLGGSATSDRRDVGPAALTAAGGRVARFGMPVDPGNLLFIGDLKGRPVLGMPGCARSPALNGVDWVLERVICGLEVTDDDIAAMGVGGLLKEIPSRPQPRAGGASVPARPYAVGALLAAGGSTRMGGRDKLLEEVGGVAQLRRAAEAMLAGGLDEVIVVLREGDAARRAALSGLAVRVVENPAAAEGMGSSIRAAVAALDDKADALMLVPADMPEIGAAHVKAVLAAFDPDEGRAICRAATAEGRPGHPVLFGRRFFEPLSRLTGDQGAREVLRENAEFVIDAPTGGEGAVVDLDTLEDWTAWRERAAN
jgi:molybdenum cofactor cytidylyltransferase